MSLFSSSSFRGGVHPHDQKKFTAHKAVEKCPVPDRVIIPVQQHIGAPSKPIVEKGDIVAIGDPLSEANGFVSIPVHASISGTVKSVAKFSHPLGQSLLAVEIEGDGEERWRNDIAFDENYMELDIDEMRKRIQNAGIAGMGGATFPTHVKISPPADKPIDTLIINGVECEPYLTSDHRLMLEEPEKIIAGMKILAKILNVKNVYIGIENNKKDAIRLFRKLADGFKTIDLHVKYPQGAEKQLIKAIVSREVPSGGLPMDVGCVVQNVGTAAAVFDAVAWKKPLIERIVTVTGKGIKEPKNLLVRIGTTYDVLFNVCGGVDEKLGKLIMGGPMMGLAQASLDLPVMKGTSGLLLFTEKEGERKKENTCISCARCVDACPMNLLPKMLVAFVQNNRFDDAEAYNILDCIECGSCSFLCPAQINLVHWIRYGKNEVIKKRKKAV